jgi:hypothetical protein
MGRQRLSLILLCVARLAVGRRPIVCLHVDSSMGFDPQSTVRQIRATSYRFLLRTAKKPSRDVPSMPTVAPASETEFPPPVA